MCFIDPFRYGPIFGRKLVCFYKSDSMGVNDNILTRGLHSVDKSSITTFKKFGSTNFSDSHLYQVKMSEFLSDMHIRSI